MGKPTSLLIESEGSCRPDLKTCLCGRASPDLAAPGQVQRLEALQASISDLGLISSPLRTQCGGLEAAKQIRRGKKLIPATLLTSRSTQATVSPPLKAKMDDDSPPPSASSFIGTTQTSKGGGFNGTSQPKATASVRFEQGSIGLTLSGIIIW